MSFLVPPLFLSLASFPFEPLLLTCLNNQDSTFLLGFGLSESAHGSPLLRFAIIMRSDHPKHWHS